MDLNGPGTSLFQGNELNNFDNLEQREEEQEALEEQRRRELELKNELENAFDDVSFDNDEESLCNGSENRSSSAHSASQNNMYPGIDSGFFKGTGQKQCLNPDDDSPKRRTEGFNTPLKCSVRNAQGKKVEFCNEYENFSDECRKKVQNGSLHDIVDQSGGGDDNAQMYLHYNHCFQRNSIGEAICNGVPNISNNNSSNNLLKTNHPGEPEDSSEQLKILYDVRVREVHRLTELIDTMRNEHKIEVGDLKHQLALLLAEKERASISHAQLQSLFVDCKQQVEHLVKEINALEKAKMELETSKQELMMEFDSAKLIIDDLQRKILVLEKGSRCRVEQEQYEINLKSISEKHNSELMNMEKELDNYKRSNEALLKENEELKLKIINLSQINDENLAKKSEIISRLSQQIEDTQMQFENLMKLSINEGNFKLQAELKLLKEEKSQLVLKIESLESERCKQEEELRQYECLSKMFSFSRDNSSSTEIKDFEGSEISGKLGAELFRALNSQKAKRLEIKNLQNQLDEKNKQILLMNESKNNLAREITSLKEEIKKYTSNLLEKESLISQKEEESRKLERQNQELMEKLKTFENENSNKCELLEEELTLLRSKISTLEKEKEECMSSYGEQYLNFHNKGLEKMREETEKFFKLEMLKKDLENETLKKEIDEIKNLYVEVCNAKENSTSQLEKERNSLGCGSAVNMEEVKRLQKELEKSRHRILEMDQTLKQQYEQEVEILNLDINQLILQLEKLKKERDRETAEKDKVSVENELLKTEIEQVTSEKNLLFLDYEKLLKEAEELRMNVDKIRENSKNELKKMAEKHSLEMQNLSNKYDITVKKLKKEIELTVTKAVKCESKCTSPIKNAAWSRNAQGCFPAFADKSTSPNGNPESKFSPVPKDLPNKTTKDASILTDPEPVKINKKDVVKMMEKLGAHHEEEMMALEKKYSADLLRLEKRFHLEVDKAKELIRRELEKEHHVELEQLEEKHRIEMMNRIEQEKKEAVVDLITEWACEVQSLKVSYAESQAEMEKLKMKYKAAKSVAFQYKTYFKSKAEHMKEEWKRIEDGYERALKELERNVHILVDVKEDEVKAKVDSITKLYEEKINRMKKKLYKFEEKLKSEKESGNKLGGISARENEMALERLVVPEGNLCNNINLLGEKGVLSPPKRLEEWDEREPVTLLKKRAEGKLKAQRSKYQQKPDMQSNREKSKS